MIDFCEKFQVSDKLTYKLNKVILKNIKSCMLMSDVLMLKTVTTIIVDAFIITVVEVAFIIIVIEVFIEVLVSTANFFFFSLIFWLTACNLIKLLILICILICSAVHFINTVL